MKKLMISLAALTAIGAAVPAAAQTWSYRHNGGYGYSYSNPAFGNNADYRTQVSNARYNEIVQRRLQLSDMINRAERRGEISNHAARDLRTRIGMISIRANNARRGGLTNREASMAVAQLDQIAERLDQVRRAPRYSYGYNNYGNYGGYDRDNYYNRGW